MATVPPRPVLEGSATTNGARMSKSAQSQIAAGLESILDLVVKIKKKDGPLSATSKARLKHAKALLRSFKKSKA